MQDYLNMLSDKAVEEIRAELVRTVGEEHFDRFVAFCAAADKSEQRIESPDGRVVLVKLQGPLSVLNERHLRASILAYVSDFSLPKGTA